MASLLPPLRLVGAHVLRDGEMQNRTLALADGIVSKGPFPAVDLGGYLILPGIVDLHGDAFERHLAPRPSARFALPMALGGADREAAANGVTTAWLAQGWSWEGGCRGPEAAVALLEALDACRGRMLTDIRVQIRCETHMTHTAGALLGAVRRHGVDYVVFNDHLGEALAAMRRVPETLAGQVARNGQCSADYIERAERALARAPEVPRFLCHLAEAFDELGVRYGSHDDADGETRERFAMIGAKIAEFPTARSAAAAARAMNDPVLMGAPNIVRGGSQAGNISALSLVRAGLCTALVSDFHYPSLARAAWTLVDKGVADLPRAWAMISERPAEIMRLTDRGRIDYGRRADVAIVNAATREVEATIAGGRLTYLAGEAGNRFMRATGPARMAAE